jgi:dihydroflavonol-4-reductase
MPDAYFITGGFGFLGQYIIQAISQHDPAAPLRVLVRSMRSLHLPVDRLPQVTLLRGELNAPASYLPALQGVHTVIHNAALVSFRKTDEQAIYQANIAGTQQLLQAAAASGCRNFIYISSISAVALQPPRLSDESMTPDLAQKKLHDPYGYSKLVGEQTVRQYASQMRVIILNPSVIIGPGSPRTAGLLRWLRWLPLLPMLNTVNSFVDVRDVAQAVVLALSRGCPGERYIITSWNIDQVSFARAALDALGRRIPVLPLPPWALKMGDGVVGLLDWLKINPVFKKPSALNVDKAYSNAKAQAELGWQPQVTLEQSMVDTLVAAGLLRRNNIHKTES